MHTLLEHELPDEDDGEDREATLMGPVASVAPIDSGSAVRGDGGVSEARAGPGPCLAGEPIQAPGEGSVSREPGAAPSAPEDAPHPPVSLPVASPYAFPESSTVDTTILRTALNSHALRLSTRSHSDPVSPTTYTPPQPATDEPLHQRHSLERLLQTHSKAFPPSTSTFRLTHPNPTTPVVDPPTPIQSLQPKRSDSLLHRRLGNRTLSLQPLTSNPTQQPQQQQQQPFLHPSSITSTTSPTQFQRRLSSPNLRTLSLIPPQRLDLTSLKKPATTILATTLDSPRRAATFHSSSSSTFPTSATPKPGLTLPDTILASLPAHSLPAWLTTLSQTPGPAVAMRFERAFQRLEEVQKLRMRGDSMDDDGGPGYSMKEAHGRGAWGRNRYSDMVPFDASRVRLVHPSVVLRRGGGVGVGGERSDYINASLMEVGEGAARKRYIGTQGPVAATVGDFWAMCWDQKVAVVVMLTKEEEKGRVKCVRYWPEAQSPVVVGGGGGSAHSNGSSILCTQFSWSHGPEAELEVVFGEQKAVRGGEVVVRRFELVRTLHPVRSEGDVGESGDADAMDMSPPPPLLPVTETRTIHHVQYLEWPDHKSADAESVLAVIDLANTFQREAGETAGPMVVHCSAGCGRTGAFCTVDSVLGRLENGEWSDAPASSMDSAYQQQQLPFSESSVPPILPLPAAAAPKDTHKQPPPLPSISLNSQPFSQPSTPVSVNSSSPLHQPDPIFETIQHLRTQRVSMVQSIEQYAFCYEAVVARLVAWEERDKRKI
ncbi:hypothetical protein HDU98_012033 [Podochytrium sp. JEL0797]|nr:hypothetical protein HDU98_012033 [Podochytrium sp. JEL0797]